MLNIIKTGVTYGTSHTSRAQVTSYDQRLLQGTKQG